MVDIVNRRETSLQPNDLAKVVYDFVQQPSDPKEMRDGANVILLMGGNDHESSAKKAYELWKEDKTRVIITTTKSGKFSPENSAQISEADDYFNILTEIRDRDSNESEDITIVHTPLSGNTIEELENFSKVLPSDIETNKVLLVDIPVHQKRAYLNARKLVPNIEFVNCPNDSDFDTTITDNQLRLVEEIERYTVYRDMETPHIPMDIMRATASLRQHLTEIGKYKKSENNPRSLYEPTVPERLYRYHERRGQAQ